MNEDAHPYMMFVVEIDADTGKKVMYRVVGENSDSFFDSVVKKSPGEWSIRRVPEDAAGVFVDISDGDAFDATDTRLAELNGSPVLGFVGDDSPDQDTTTGGHDGFSNNGLGLALRDEPEPKGEEGAALGGAPQPT